MTDKKAAFIFAVVYAAVIFSVRLHLFQVLDSWRAGLCGFVGVQLSLVLIYRWRFLDLWSELFEEIFAGSKLLPAIAMATLVTFTYLGLAFVFGLAAVQLINATFDRSEPRLVAAEVIRKSESHSVRLGPSFSIGVKSWRQGRQSEEIGVTGPEYLRLAPGKSRVEVAAKKGALGFEWVKGHRVIH